LLNTDSFDEYYKLIDSGKMAFNRGYIRDKEQQLRWSIALPLKNTEVRKDRFEKINGMPIENCFKKKWKKLMDNGLVVDKPILGYPSYTLTELGKFVADECAEEFNSNEFLPWKPEEYIHGPLFPYDDNTTEDALGLI
jgi:coproporphyrinogen III oxidase-like Fe-S oxidoreductase